MLINILPPEEGNSIASSNITLVIINLFLNLNWFLFLPFIGKEIRMSKSALGV